MSIPAQPNVKLNNAPDYREAYANSVQMRVNVWDFFMVFGTLQQQTETQVEIRNSQGCSADATALASRRTILRDYRSDQSNAVQWSGTYPALVFAVIFVFIFLLHLPVLQLPYFWDEAGYYVPAARDLLLTGSLIPHSTPSNAHPPLVMAYLALFWRLAGYSALVTRSAMLLVAAFALLGLFRLAQRVANAQIAVASTICTALYPVFFVQSSLAQVDLA